VGGEVIGVVECDLLSIAKCGCDRVASDAGDCGLRVGDNNAVLDVEPLDLVHGTCSSSGICEELSDHGEDRVGINGQAWAIKCGVAHAVRVEITSIWIRSTGVSACRVCTSTCIFDTHCLRCSIGRMGGQGC